jgi:hypothetical protein
MQRNQHTNKRNIDKAPRTEASAKIEAQIQAFFKKGGEVEVLPSCGFEASTKSCLSINSFSHAGL